MAKDDLIQIELTADAKKLEKEIKDIQKNLKTQINALQKSVSTLMPNFSKLNTISKQLKSNLSQASKSMNAINTGVSRTNKSLGVTNTNLTKAIAKAKAVTKELKGMGKPVDVAINQTTTNTENQMPVSSTQEQQNTASSMPPASLGMGMLAPAMIGAGLGASRESRTIIPRAMPKKKSKPEKAQGEEEGQKTTTALGALKKALADVRNNTAFYKKELSSVSQLIQSITGKASEVKAKVYSKDSHLTGVVDKQKEVLKGRGVENPLPQYVKDQTGGGMTKYKEGDTGRLKAQLETAQALRKVQIGAKNVAKEIVKQERERYTLTKAAIAATKIQIALNNAAIKKGRSRGATEEDKQNGKKARMANPALREQQSRTNGELQEARNNVTKSKADVKSDSLAILNTGREISSLRERLTHTKRLTTAQEKSQIVMRGLKQAALHPLATIKTLGIQAKFAFVRGVYNGTVTARQGIDALKTKVTTLMASMTRTASVGRMLGNGFKNIVPKAKALGKQILKVRDNLQKYVDKTKAASAETKKLNSAAKGAAGGGLKSMLKSLMAYASVAMVFQQLKASILAGMAEIENDNVFRTAFNDEALVEMYAFCDGAINKFGMTTDAAKELSGTFMLLGANLLGSKEGGLELSKVFTQLTVDFGSFYNVSNERSAELMVQGLTGQTKGLKKYGIIVSATAAKNYAYANGIAAVGAELTESQKVQARAGVMMAQLTQVNGDFQATINTGANQLKIFGATLQQTRINIGRAFDPILRVVLPALNLLFTALNTVIEKVGLFMEAMFGKKMKIEGLDSNSSGLDNMGSSAENAGNQADAAAKKFKGLMGIDEINTLGSESDSDASSDDFEVPDLNWDTEDKVEIEIPPSIQALADHVKSVAATLWKPISEAWDIVSPALTTQMELAWTNWLSLWSYSKNWMSSVWDNGGEEIFGDLIETVLQVGVICGRVYNETLIPMVKNFTDALDPEKTPGAKGFLWVMQQISEAVKNFVTYLAGDGFYWVDAFVKCFVVWKILAFVGGIVVAMATAVASGLIWLVNTAIMIANGAIWIANTGYIIASTAATWLWNAAMIVAGLPVWALILVIGLLVLAFIYCYDQFEWFRDGVKTVIGAIATVFSGTIKTVIGVLTTGVGAILGIFTGLWTSISAVFDNIMGIFTGLIDFIVNIFTGNWSAAWDAVISIIGNLFGGIANIVLMPINAIIGMVNALIKGLNKISLPDWLGGASLNLPEIPKLSVPALAKGGIVNSPTLAMVGEAGKEAVMPLENNTGWIKQLAGDIAGQLGGGNTGTKQESQVQNDRPIEVTLQLNETKLGKAVIKSINSLQKQEGKVLIRI